MGTINVDERFIQACHPMEQAGLNEGFGQKSP